MRIPQIRLPFTGASRATTDVVTASATHAAKAAPTPPATAAGQVAADAKPKASAAAPDPTPTPSPDPKPAPAPERQGLSGAGIFGMTAGTAGLAVTTYNSFKSEFGKQSNGGSAIGPSTYAVGGGAALLLMAGNGGSFIKNAMRGTGALLVLGGVAGASAGAIERIRAPKVDPDDPTVQNQSPQTFASGPPATAADLAGIEVALARVKTIDKGTRGERDVSVYVDPATAVAVSREAGLEQAIAQARALSQGDAQNRSHAVIQTKDGAYAITRLVGDLDQVDGRGYATDNTFDREFEPHIDKLQPSLQAIVGVERKYDLRRDEPLSGTEPIPDLGDIPWVTPQLPPASTTTTPKPAGS